MEETRESQEEEKVPVADIVDVRFRTPGRAGAFLFRDGQAEAGDLLIVESKRGAELGEAIGPSRPRWPDESGIRMPRVLRVADDSDDETDVVEGSSRGETEAERKGRSGETSSLYTFTVEKFRS